MSQEEGQKATNVIRRLLLSPENPEGDSGLLYEMQNSSENLIHKSTERANPNMTNANMDLADIRQDESKDTDPTSHQKAIVAFSQSQKLQGVNDTSGSSKIIIYNNSQVGFKEEGYEPQDYDQIAELSQEHIIDSTSKQYEIQGINKVQLGSDPKIKETPPKLNLANMRKSEDNLNKRKEFGNLNNESNFFIDHQDILGKVDGISSDLSIEHENDITQEMDPGYKDPTSVPRNDSLLLNRPERINTAYQHNTANQQPFFKPKTQQAIRVPVQEYLNATQHGQALMARNKQHRSVNKRRDMGKSVNLASRQKSILMSSDQRDAKPLDSSASARHILFHSKRTPSHYNMPMTKPTESQNNDIASFLSDADPKELQQAKIKRKSVSTLQRYQNTSNQPSTNQSKAKLPTISFQQQQMLQSHYKQKQQQYTRFNKSMNASSMSNIYQKKGGRPEQLKIQQNFYENNQFIMTPNESVFAGHNYQGNMSLPLKRRELTKTQQNIMKSLNMKQIAGNYHERPSLNNDELKNFLGDKESMNSYTKSRQQFQIGQAQKEMTQQPIPENEGNLAKPKLEESQLNQSQLGKESTGDGGIVSSKTQTYLGRESTRDGGHIAAVTSLSGGIESGRTRSSIRLSQNNLQSSFKKHHQIYQRAQNQIQTGSVAFENLSDSKLNQTQLIPRSEAGPKNEKLYNQKAQLAVSLSKELYKAKQILKDVVESQTNRKNSQRQKQRKRTHHMVKSMKDGFVNPDIFNPTADYSEDGSFLPKSIKNRQSQKVLTEKKGDLNDEVIISIPINEEEEPKVLNSTRQNTNRQNTTQNQQGIHIQDQAVAIHSEVNTIFLDKIMAEGDLNQKKIRLPPTESPIIQERARKKQQLEKAYAQATKVPLKLMQIQEIKAKPKNESAHITKKNSLANIGLNRTKSQDKLDDIKKQFSEGNHLGSRQQSTENIHKFKQVYNLHKVPLLELIEQRNRSKEKNARNMQYQIKTNPLKTPSEYKFVSPIDHKIANAASIKKIELSQKHEIVQSIQQLDKMKKVHSDFQKLQNIGNYHGPILQQIKNVVSQKEGSSQQSKSHAKNTSRLYPELSKQNKSQSNFQYFFDQKEMAISGSQRAIGQNLQAQTPTNGVNSTASFPQKKKTQKHVSSHRASNSAFDLSTPPDPAEALRKMNEIQKQIDDMHQQMNDLNRKKVEDDLKYQAKFLEHEQRTSFQQGLRKKLLAIRQGQLMVNTPSGEQLYQDLLDKQRQASLERQRQEKQKRQRELSRKRLAEASSGREGRHGPEHLYQNLKHQDCKKCANSKNEQLATVYKYKGHKPPNKFILPRDPIERYYRRYVQGQDDSDEEKYHVEMDPYDLHHPTFTHHVTCPCSRFNITKLMKQWKSKNSALNSRFMPDKMPSKEHQIDAIDEINRIDSPEQAYHTSRMDNSVHAMLLAVYQKCDCHMRYKESLLRRMRNQELYKQFLREKEEKNKYSADKKHKRTKSDYLKVYGYEQPPERRREGASKVGARDASSVDGAFELRRHPCRRTCSTTHNPMFHCKHNDIKLRYCRPQTARYGDFEEVDYDWFRTDIDAAVRENKNQLQLDPIKEPKEFSKPRGDNPEEGSKNEDEQTQGTAQRSRTAERSRAERSRAESEALFPPPPNEDMKLVMKHLGNKLFQETPRKRDTRLLTANEVEYYYHALKRPNIRNNFTVEERLDLVEHAWNTLELLMKSLMLQREYEILNDSCKRKQLDIDIMYNSRKSQGGQPALDPATDRNLTESILKVLIRLKKTFEATETITKILLKITKRENLVNQFLVELNECSNIRAKGYYYVILKLSGRIYNQIERLRVDHPLLNRPFIYANSNYCPYLIKDGLILRRIVAKSHPDIKEEIDRVLDKSGKIVPLSLIVELNQEMQWAMEEDLATGVVTEHESPGKRNYGSRHRHGGCGHKRTYKLNRLQALADRESMGFFDDLFMFAMRNPGLSLDF